VGPGETVESTYYILVTVKHYWYCLHCWFRINKSMKMLQKFCGMTSPRHRSALASSSQL